MILLYIYINDSLSVREETWFIRAEWLGVTVITKVCKSNTRQRVRKLDSEPEKLADSFPIYFPPLYCIRGPVLGVHWLSNVCDRVRFHRRDWIHAKQVVNISVGMVEWWISDSAWPLRTPERPPRSIACDWYTNFAMPTKIEAKTDYRITQLSQTLGNCSGAILTK